MSATIKTMLVSIHRMPSNLGGICGQPTMTYLSPKAFHMVRQMMPKWPKFSGVYDYPVPSTIEGYSPSECYHECSKKLWDRDTEYGALRWELLEWLMEQPELNVPLYRMYRGNERPVFNIKD